MFLALSILPGVPVLGGRHQPVYYPLMRHVVRRALEAGDGDADLRQALATDDMPGAWGHRVIEQEDDPIALFLDGSACGMGGLIERFGDLTSLRHVET